MIRSLPYISCLRLPQTKHPGAYKSQISGIQGEAWRVDQKPFRALANAWLKCRAISLQSQFSLTYQALWEAESLQLSITPSSQHNTGILLNLKTRALIGALNDAAEKMVSWGMHDEHPSQLELGNGLKKVPEETPVCICGTPRWGCNAGMPSSPSIRYLTIERGTRTAQRSIIDDLPLWEWAYAWRWWCIKMHFSDQWYAARTLFARQLSPVPLIRFVYSPLQRKPHSILEDYISLRWKAFSIDSPVLRNALVMGL